MRLYLWFMVNTDSVQSLVELAKHTENVIKKPEQLLEDLKKNKALM